MKNAKQTLICTALLVALGGCGGSSEEPTDSATARVPVADDQASGIANLSTAADQSLSGVADLVIQNASVVMSDSSTRSIDFSFDIADTGGANIVLDDLSVALEIAAVGSFENGYRQSLYDIRASSKDDQLPGTVSMTARSAPAGLPAGNYVARLVVNPNWQNSFELLPADIDQSQPYRFITERDYMNNASDTFNITVQSTTVCAEDEFEPNNSIETALEIPVGAEVSASLCADTVDFYSVDLAAGQSTRLDFDYVGDSGNASPATSYVVLDPASRIMSRSVARDSGGIRISATDAGSYILALYGQRSNYRIGRQFGVSENFADDFSNDSFFSAGRVSGPTSWLHGDITLHRLAFSESQLANQTVNCGRITTQFRDEAPVAYVTPQHFADIYQFQFLEDGTSLIDGEAGGEWSVFNGDITNGFWYTNDYPGYAEKIGDHGWRYWTTDGLSYVDCEMEAN